MPEIYKTTSAFGRCRDCLIFHLYYLKINERYNSQNITNNQNNHYDHLNWMTQRDETALPPTLCFLHVFCIILFCIMLCYMKVISCITRGAIWISTCPLFFSTPCRSTEVEPTPLGLFWTAPSDDTEDPLQNRNGGGYFKDWTSPQLRADEWGGFGGWISHSSCPDLERF